MMSNSGKIVCVDPQSNRECTGAKEIISDLQKWADEGRIKAISVGVVFTDNSSFTDWCSDYPINIEHVVGNIDRLKFRILQKEEGAGDE